MYTTKSNPDSRVDSYIYLHKDNKTMCVYREKYITNNISAHRKGENTVKSQ